ncbi:MAG: alpha-D-ribose 1-methylphosphonate 5-triphosphate diphosphatase [Marinobacter sp.]
MVLTNARVVTENECFDGTVHIRNGMIADVTLGRSQLPGALDCGAAILMPGMVELHTDNLEKHISPRPGVLWPSVPAVITHDAQIVASGITTVFDAISVGDIVAGSTRLQTLETMVNALKACKRDAMMRADHFLHLRCEVSHQGALEMFRSLVDQPMLQLVSIMDHSPGQRQFVNLDKYREYYMGKHGLSAGEMEEFIRTRQEDSRRYSDRYREAIVGICQERAIPLASHDDATADHVEESAGFGMSIAEFPTTLEAARESHQRGMKVMMGAPNIVRGGSHSGNIAAASLAEEGVLDILSSDYYPASMLDAAFRLARLETNDYDLTRAIAAVTAVPARCAGLEDRGSIAAGKRADLVLVSECKDQPVIETVWRAGKRVY